MFDEHICLCVMVRVHHTEAEHLDESSKCFSVALLGSPWFVNVFNAVNDVSKRTLK